ncbi:MAG TPA: enterochelin esterase, partial [bacterium]|nr:enterochelin esterase [bacterium]
PGLLKVLAKHEESVEKFLEHVWKREKLSHDEGMALMMVGMAAHYDPDPAAPLGLHLPFDPHTGRVDGERWARWLPHDPVRMVEEPASAEALLSLKGLYIDCGTKDQFHLLWGARMLHERLEALGVPHEYQEFDDDHSDVDYRMDISLPYLYRAIAPA